MSPTWSAFTLLLLSTIMLLVTWLAAKRRLSQLGGENAANLKAVQDAQNVLLVRFLGLSFGLSTVVLLAVITFLTDSVSTSWCVFHGLLIYMFTFLSLIHLVGLSLTMWISHIFSAAQYEVPQWVRMFTPVAIAFTALLAFVMLLVGRFEQQTLFCFPYQPLMLNMILFKVPILTLTLLSLFFSGNACVQLARLQPLTLQDFVRIQLAKYSKTRENDLQQAANNERYYSKEREIVEAEQSFDLLQAQGMPVQMDKFGPVVTFSQIQSKVTIIVFLLSLLGFAAIVYELTVAESSHKYYQGKDTLSSIIHEESKAEQIHESRLGFAVFGLSAVGIFLFVALGTDRTLWETRKSFSNSSLR